MIEASVLPALQADETIYSWCATAHVMSGWPSTEKWSLATLGMAHSARQHDFQAYLPHLASHHLSTLTLIDAIRHHTLAGMFWPFAPAGLKARLEQSPTTGRVAWPNSAQYARRVLLSHSRTLSWKAQLRYCPQCVPDDLTKIGRPYWHVSHQWPVSRICLRHGRRLVEVGTPYKTWKLPPTADPPASDKVSAPVHCTFDRIAQGVADTLTRYDTIDTLKLKAYALRRLQQLGVIHSTYATRHTRLDEWYQGTAASTWCSGSGGALACLASSEWIPRMLWRRTHDHPIRWVILWSALEWPDAESAVAALSDSQAGVTVGEFGQMQLLLDDSDVTKSPTGRSTHPAFHDALELEDSYAGLMRRLHASRGDVVRWLEAAPAARQSWRQRLQRARIERAEQVLMALIQNHPALSRDDLNAIGNKEISLLRRHVPQRLQQLLSMIPSRIDAQLRLFPK